MMFRYGYKKDFPRTTIEEETIKAALSADREAREARGREINSSNHRMETRVQPNQLVYTRNMARNKFDPIFGPELYKVVDVKGNGTTLLRLSDSQIVRRHLDDVKEATPAMTDNETCWIDCNRAPNPQPHYDPNDLAPLPPIVPQQAQPHNPQAQPIPPVADGNQRPQRERRQPAYYRDECWVME